MLYYRLKNSIIKYNNRLLSDSSVFQWREDRGRLNKKSTDDGDRCFRERERESERLIYFTQRPQYTYTIYNIQYTPLKAWNDSTYAPYSKWVGQLDITELIIKLDSSWAAALWKFLNHFNFATVDYILTEQLPSHAHPGRKHAHCVTRVNVRVLASPCALLQRLCANLEFWCETLTCCVSHNPVIIYQTLL